MPFYLVLEMKSEKNGRPSWGGVLKTGAFLVVKDKKFITAFKNESNTPSEY